MSGIRLQMNKKLDRTSPVEMELFLPQDDLAEYSRQHPVKLRGKISWQRVEEDKFVCGIAFESVSGDFSSRLREGFKYYNKLPEFSAAR